MDLGHGGETTRGVAVSPLRRSSGPQVVLGLHPHPRLSSHSCRANWWSSNIQHLPTSPLRSSPCFDMDIHAAALSKSSYQSLASAIVRQSDKGLSPSKQALDLPSGNHPFALNDSTPSEAGRCFVCSGVLSVKYCTWCVPTILCLDISNLCQTLLLKEKKKEIYIGTIASLMPSHNMYF